MSLIRSSYPLTFNLDDVDLCESSTVSTFLNILQTEQLYELEFKNEVLYLVPRGVFTKVGLQNDALFSTPKIESRTIQYLSKALRQLYVSKSGGGPPSNEQVMSILRESDETSKVYSILYRIDGLRNELIESGASLFQHADESEHSSLSYVSNILASYWVSNAITDQSVISSRKNFWETCVYDGSVRGLRQLLSRVSDVSGAFQSSVLSRRLVIEVPKDRYPLLYVQPPRDDERIYFNRYQIIFYPEITGKDIIRGELSFGGMVFMNVLPHYGIYHTHYFLNQDDLVRYMEYTVFRSQRERAEFRSAVQNRAGLRFCRGGLFGVTVSKYLYFLNFLLWNSLYYELDLNYTLAGDWHRYLFRTFTEFDKTNPSWVTDKYSCNGRFYVNSDLRHYIRVQFVDAHINTLNVSNPELSVLRALVQTYLELTLDSSDLVPTVRAVGRVTERVTSTKGVLIQTLCLGDPIYLNDISHAKFNTRMFSVPSKVNLSIQYNDLCGFIRNCSYVDAIQPFDPYDFIGNVAIIRSANGLRQLWDDFTFPYAFSRFWLVAFSKFAIFSDLRVDFGGAILLFACDPLSRFIRYKGVEVLDNRMHFNFKFSESHFFDARNTINSSTPKLSSTLSTVLLVISSLWAPEEHIHIPWLRRVFAKMLILGAVGDADPIFTGFRILLETKVTQVGALATGFARRSLAQEFQFSQGFSAIISDMDQSSFLTFHEFYRFYHEVIIYYMNGIQPLLAIWKINYCTDDTQRVILDVVNRYLLHLDSYRIAFISPKFCHFANDEKYLIFYRTAPDYNIRYFGIEFFTPSPLVRLAGECLYERRQMGCASFDDVRNLFSGHDSIRTTVSIELGLTQIRNVLPLVLYSCDRIELSRLRGLPTVLCTGVSSIDRVFLTRRSPNVYGFTPSDLDELSPDTMQTNLKKSADEVVSQSIGDFCRGLWRTRTSYDIFRHYDIARRLKVVDHFAYVGIGDERARNVRCVPIKSPYIIVDERAHVSLTKFSIDVRAELLDWNQFDRYFRDLHRQYPGKRLKIFFLFMLYNDSPTVQVLEGRLRLIRDLVLREPWVESIYLNYYFIDPVIDQFDAIEPDQVVTFGGGITIMKRLVANVYHFYGTFGIRYDPVELWPLARMLEVLHHPNLNVLSLGVDISDMYSYMWSDGCIPNLESVAFINLGLNFSRVIRLSRRG